MNGPNRYNATSGKSLRVILNVDAPPFFPPNYASESRKQSFNQSSKSPQVTTRESVISGGSKDVQVPGVIPENYVNYVIQPPPGMIGPRVLVNLPVWNAPTSGPQQPQSESSSENPQPLALPAYVPPQMPCLRTSYMSQQAQLPLPYNWQMPHHSMSQWRQNG